MVLIQEIYLDVIVGNSGMGQVKSYSKGKVVNKDFIETITEEWWSSILLY